MRVSVLGANGRTGRLVVVTLLARGHAVTGLVRTPGNFQLRHDALTMVTGTVDDVAALADAVADSRAVISTVTAGKGILTRLAANLVPILQESGPKRIVTLGGAATELSGDPQAFKRRLFLFMLGMGSKAITDDLRAHWAALQASGLEASLVRPPRLTNGPGTGTLKHGPDLALGLMDSISRAVLATFLADIALDGRYAGTAPFVASA